jgi:hypothetical protein
MSLENSINELGRRVDVLCDLIAKLVDIDGVSGNWNVPTPGPVAESIAAGEEQIPPETDNDAGAEAVSKEKEITTDDLKARFVALVNAKDSAAMYSILKEFGADKLSGIRPEQYVAVAQAIEEAMGAE